MADNKGECSYENCANEQEMDESNDSDSEIIVNNVISKTIRAFIMVDLVEGIKLSF